MYGLIVFAATVLLSNLVVSVVADSPTPMSYDGSSQDVVTAFKPSLGVVIGILSIMFSLTFFILVYAKFCHRAAAARHFQRDGLGELTRTRSQLSGIDKKVIESLPFFRFSALKGSREGLECVVCLSKFEDIEMLRLLPICKHAFHIDCIDQWLENHSSCPLCRHKISPTDPQVFAYSNSLRFLQSQSEERAESNMEIIINREANSASSSIGSSLRYGIGSSFRKPKKADKDTLIQAKVEDEDDSHQFHRFNHKIVVSDVVFKNRWSSVSSSDLMFLNSELLNATASDRFVAIDSNTRKSASDIVEEEPRSSNNIPGNRTRQVNQNERRSVSEITGLSRFQVPKIDKKISMDSDLGYQGVIEERRRIWFPIARRTVRWFANREVRTQQNWRNNNDNKSSRQDLAV